jgi:hypothetical protein
MGVADRSRSGVCCHLPNDAITSCLREPEPEADSEPVAAAFPTLFDLEGSPAEAVVWTSILREYGGEGVTRGPSRRGC